MKNRLLVLNVLTRSEDLQSSSHIALSHVSPCTFPIFAYRIPPVLPLHSVLRLVFTEENKHGIGLDFFASCISRSAGQKKLKMLQRFIIRVADHRFKLEQKIGTEAHARVQFCSDSVRSHAYFPWSKSAFRLQK